MVEWLLLKVVNHVRRYWLTLTLFILLVSIVTYSLDSANWVTRDRSLVTIFLSGIVLGWLLAFSRFRAWMVTAYAALMGFLLTLNSVGQVIVVPDSFRGAPFWTLVDQLNLRAFTFYLRVTGWIEVLQSGESLKDTGLFEILLGYVLLLAAVWLMFWTIRRRSMLVALLPVGFLLAVNMNLARQPLAQYMYFLFVAMLMIARTNYTWQNEDWARRKVDYPDQLGMEWAAGAATLALIVTLIARAAPLFGTPEGWQAISKFVNRAREETAKTTERWFGGVNPPPPSPDLEQQAIVDTPNLGQVGTRFSQGTLTVMWVKTSDPSPLPPEIQAGMPFAVAPTRVHYWRSGIFSAYNGRGWDPVLTGDPIIQPDSLPREPPVGRYQLNQVFTMEARHTGELFSVNDPIRAGPQIDIVTAGSPDTSLLRGSAKQYQVVSYATDVTANFLDAAGDEYPPETAPYLQIPASTPERVHALAQRVSAAGGTPYQKVVLIQEYLRANYTYDLGVKLAPAQRDVVDYFLFDEKKGFCSHYASAMVVMLRTVGVPTRVVTGYAMGEWNQERAAYRVPESSAHAWVEVYFPGYGWAEFEPTASRDPFVYPEEVPVMDPTAVAQVGSPGMVPPGAASIALTFIGALVLLALPFLLVYLFGVMRARPTIRPDVLYRQVRRALGWAGLTAAPSLTPDEYLARCRAPLAGYDSLQRALVQVTDVYRLHVYSPHPPDARLVRRAAAAWAQSTRQWLLLFLRSAPRRLRG